MDLALNETQQMLRSSARDLLKRECTGDVLQAIESDPAGRHAGLWRKVADQGWLGLAVPEEWGGAGGSLVDLCVLLEEMGRAPLPGPYRSTALVALAVARFGSERQREELLPAVSRGEVVAALALPTPSPGFRQSSLGAEAQRGEDAYALHGTVPLARDAAAADVLLLPALAGPEVACFLVPTSRPGVSIEPLGAVGPDSLAEVRLHGAEVGAQATLGPVDGGWQVVEWAIRTGAAMECAWMVGGAEAVLEMTTAYTTDRKQFGQPVGSFQAIQHHCANMAIQVDGCRFVTYQAASRLAEGEDGGEEVSLAKAWVGESYQRVCALAHQCHGAIGFTREHPLHRYSRQARASEVAFGDAEYHRERVATTLGL